ncbi:hypothetical protein KP509_01G011700 [Ceratopteris richardii]|nr:hypothetical protein KP509_01G011700 [Ceratopteris richardii]
MVKLTEEIDTVVGKTRFLTEKDIENLPYLQMVVKESLRLHPPGALLLPHESMEDCKIGGYDIPSNTMAYVNVWAIGRDPSIWETPQMFLPERFEGKNVTVYGRHFDLLPFGSGRRMCPGWSLAMADLHLLIGTFVQAYSLSVNSGNQSDVLDGATIDFSEKAGSSISMRTPLAVFARPRLPLHMYQPSS